MTANFPRPTSRITCAGALLATKRGPLPALGDSVSLRATRGNSLAISRPTLGIDRPGPATMPVCVSELRYVGHADLMKDLDNFTAALAGVNVVGAYLPANTPGTIEHWMLNEYYKSDEAFVFAIADAMHEEYQAIVDAGFLLQIDDPDLPDGWNCLPDISLSEYRKYATMRVDALNHALKGIPREKVRLHVCWGSHHGPHHDDIPLKDIIDLIFRVNAGSFSIEASNPCHEHEWTVFEEVKLPDGATLIPGVVGHCTDFIEHPDLVAERLVRYAHCSDVRGEPIHTRGVHGALS